MVRETPKDKADKYDKEKDDAKKKEIRDSLLDEEILPFLEARYANIPATEELRREEKDRIREDIEKIKLDNDTNTRVKKLTKQIQDLDYQAQKTTQERQNLKAKEMEEIEKLKKQVEELRNEAKNDRTIYSKIDELNQEFEKLQRLKDVEPKSNNSKQKMSSQLPKFSGRSNEDVEKWIFTIERDMDYNDIDYHKRMLAIASLLDGHPFHMYKKYMESEKTKSWSEFKNMLRQMFATTNKDLDIRTCSDDKRRRSLSL